MWSSRRFLPSFKQTWFLFTAFAYCASEVFADKTPVNDLSDGLSFSAGFPVDGVELCLGNPRCSEAYVYVTATAEPLLQVASVVEVDETTRQQEAVTIAQKQVTEYIHRETENEIDKQSRQYAKARADFQFSGFSSEVQARVNQFNEDPIVAQQKVYDKLYDSQYDIANAELHTLKYDSLYDHFYDTDFEPKLQEAMAAIFQKSNERAAELYKLSDILFLKKLYLSLDVELEPATMSFYNRGYKAVSAKWHHLYFNGTILFKGKPLHKGVTFQSAFAEATNNAISSAQTSEALHTALNVFLIWGAVLALVGGVGCFAYQYTPRTRYSEIDTVHNQYGTFYSVSSRYHGTTMVARDSASQPLIVASRY